MDNNTLDKILEGIERLERTLLMLTPYRRLPVDLQRRAAELQGHVVKSASGDERAELLHREFEKLANSGWGVRSSAKWPKVLIPPPPVTDPETLEEIEKPSLPVMPLSTLVNRCVARKVFKIAPGEVSPRANVEESARKEGYVITTLKDCKLDRESTAAVIMTKETFSALRTGKLKPAEKVVREAEESFEAYATRRGVKVEPEKEYFKVPESNVEVEMEFDENETPDALTVEDEEEEEEFETSSAAQGVGTVPDRDDEEDEIVEDDEDEDKFVDEEEIIEEQEKQLEEPDEDWGPDEVEFDNPVRDEMKKAWDDAWAREQEALASGEMVLVDGIPVARKKKN